MAGAVGTVRYGVQGHRLASALMERWPESVPCVSALCFLLNPTVVVLRWEDLSQDCDLLRKGVQCPRVTRCPGTSVGCQELSGRLLCLCSPVSFVVLEGFLWR